MNVEQEINSIDLFHEYSDDVEKGNSEMIKIKSIKDYINENSYKIDLEKLTSDGKFGYERYFPQLYSKSISDNN
jgi:hypothetical protein